MTQLTCMVGVEDSSIVGDPLVDAENVVAGDVV